MNAKKYWCCDAEFGKHEITCEHSQIPKEKLKEILGKCLGIIEELIDPEECSYDHHNYCQSHGLHEYPCPHGRAKEMLKEIIEFKVKKNDPEIVNCTCCAIEKSDEEIVKKLNLRLMSDIGEQKDLEEELDNIEKN